MCLKRFLNDESGAITVDWVVLTASIVGIAIAVLIIIATGIQSASTGVNGNLENTESVADGISGVVGSTSGDNNGLPRNLSDYTYEDGTDHAHYTDESTGTRYRIQDGESTMTDPSGTTVATVDDDGNVTAI